MKAWDDLNRAVSLYWTGDENEPKSYWYMDHGVKIEMFVEDGRFEINNVMMAGDHYYKVTSEQYDTFMESGWLAGCYRVCIETYSDRILRARKLLKIHGENEELLGRLDNIRKKLLRYVELNNNLLVSL